MRKLFKAFLCLLVVLVFSVCVVAPISADDSELVATYTDGYQQGYHVGYFDGVNRLSYNADQFSFRYPDPNEPPNGWYNYGLINGYYEGYSDGITGMPKYPEPPFIPYFS